MDEIKIENNQLKVCLGRVPVVLEISDREGTVVLQGGDPQAGIEVNGLPTKWEDWTIQSDNNSTKGEYRLTGAPHGIPCAVRVRYELEEGRLRAELSLEEDEQGKVQSLGWPGKWLLSTSERRMTLFRERIQQLSWKRIKFSREEAYLNLRESPTDNGPIPAVVTCLFDGTACAYLRSSERVMPFTTFVDGVGSEDGMPRALRMGPGSYQVRNRNGKRDPLVVSVELTPDVNGDGQADECDYLLLLNRSMPEPDSVYKNSFWYKITCVEPERGMVSTFKEAEEIIRSIHHILDGWKQVPLLTAWSFERMDTSPVNMDLMGFGGMESITDHAGTAEEIRELHRVSKENYNATVSYHMNVDDSYTEYPGWDEAIICRDAAGQLVEWIKMFGRTGYHISHTKDVESGKVFERLDRFRKFLPLEGAVHLDAFRNTNMHWDETGFIGMVDELECGVQPIIDYFHTKGISVSIEGARQMPMQQVGWLSAFWHLSRLPDFPARAVLFHGKAIGGGVPGCPQRVAQAFGTSIDTDICYHPSPLPSSLSLSMEWYAIVDLLYLGFLLYQFYLRFELLAAKHLDDRFRLTFSDSLEAEVEPYGEWLKVKWGDLIIAEDDVRMLPFEDALYFYSVDDLKLTRKLPAEWSTGKLVAWKLSKDGREPFQDWKREEGTIQIDLRSRQPIKFMKAGED